MNVRVNLYSVLRVYGPGGNDSATLTLREGARVADVLAALSIPPDVERILLVNGRNVDEDQPLSEGDEVALFPPVAGG